MAEVTAFRNDALPYPVYGAPYTIVVSILDADGDPVSGAAALDSERSLNGDTPADCTNEATEIGSSGQYYLTLTAAELTADIVSGVTKTSTSGAKTTPWVLYPRKLVTIRSGTAASAGSLTNTIVLDSGASALDDFYNGMLCLATIDGNVEARIISDYVGSTKSASVVPDWNVAPDNDDTFVIKLSEGVQVPTVNLVAWLDVAPLALSSQRVQVLVGAVTNGVIAAASFASGALDAVWSVATRVLTAGTNIVLAKGTGITGFNDLSAAQVNAEADTAIADAALATAANLATVDGVVDAIKVTTDKLDDTLEDNAGTFRFTAAALAEAPTDGAAPTAAAIADAVWEEALADHSGTAGSVAESLAAAGSAGDPWATALPGSYTAGQAGKILGDNLNATVGSRASQTSVDDLPTNAELSTALAGADDAVLSAIGGLNDLDAADVRAAVGLASADLDTQLAALPTAAENAAGVRTELATELGRLDAAVSTRATPAQVNTEADAALADVGLTSTITGRIDAAVSTRASQTSVDDLPTNSELATALAAADDAILAAIAALNNLSAAQVNAEVDQAISDAALATAAALSTAQTAITAIKAKTDSLTFTQAGTVDANVQRVHDVALDGVGTADSPWRPAA